MFLKHPISSKNSFCQCELAKKYISVSEVFVDLKNDSIYVKKRENSLKSISNTAESGHNKHCGLRQSAVRYFSDEIILKAMKQFLP